MKSQLIPCLAAALLLAPAAARPQQPAPGPDVKAAAVGQLIYVRYCGSCHGELGKGDGAIAKDLVVPPTDLTTLAKKNEGKFPYQRVVELIDGRKLARGHGTADMPVWGEIFPKTQGTASPDVRTAVARIAHYVWSIQVK